MYPTQVHHIVQLVLPLFLLSTLIVSAADPTPPVAPTVDHREVRHDATVVDNYYWLREKSNPKVVAYLEAENAYTAAMTGNLAPFQDALYKEMLGHVKQTDLSVPVRRADYLYYSRTVEGQQYPIQCRRKGSMEAPEEILLDPNELAKSHKFVGLGAFVVSDDQNMLAYTIDYTGFRQYGLQVKDLRSGETLPDTTACVTAVAWAADNKTLFLTTEDAVTKRSDKLWRHVLGASQFEPLYDEKDELYDIRIQKTRDQKYLLLGIDSKDTTEYCCLRADHPQGDFTVFLPREKKHRYYVDHRENLFYIRTNKDGRNFAIMTAPENDPAPRNWKVFIAQRDDVLLEHLDLFQDFAVSVERSRALDHLRVYDFHTAQWTAIPFPEPVYAASPGGTPEFTSHTYRYNYQSFITPPSVFDYDVHSGQSALLKRQDVLGGYDPTQYVCERLWATARDGVKVPISIVYRKGFVRDGHAPLFLYAYGSYGIGTPPGFSSNRLSLLDRGMAYAIAHIRGGNEMGEQWREDGMLMKKKNTFWDFIDCAEFLIAEKWTSKERLVIEGGSAGGLLMGAVVNMRPDLFHAVHAAVPFVDVMNTMMDASLPLTVGEYLEWGNPNEKEAYDYMKTYSPYDNLEKRAYPAILVTTSFNDSQVMYWEPAKYVARMRALKTNDTPLLLKIKMEPAGHGGASGRYDRMKDQAFEYAWLLTQVGITR
ncbi:MAG TPA: S9 family peptidase [Bryobacteraceae bacterium]|jgi:oligopeptidase B|nr:S9 family peptidase [Bryobacteraceae bacterium]